MKGYASISKDLPTKGNLAILDKYSGLNLPFVDSNVNVVQDDVMSWWTDSRASRHVFKSKQWFKTLHVVLDRGNLDMRDDSSIKVQGKGQINLLFTSENILILRDIYFAPDISRNLVSGPILNRLGYKLVFEIDRCIISKCNFLIGRGYLCCNLFKLSLICNSKNMVCNTNMCDDLHYLWHLRLANVNFGKVSFMSKNNLIPLCYQKSENYNTCMLNKITRTHFKSVQRKSEILELIHNDLYDFHNISY